MSNKSCVHHSQFSTTLFSTKLQIGVLVILLSSAFSLQNYGCLALMMLGDCYVAISGVPINNSDGPQAVVSLSLDMIQAVQ